MKDYGESWGLTEIFKEYSSGVKTHRDRFVVGFEQKELLDRFERFKNDTNVVLKAFKLKDTRDWKIKIAKAKTHKTNISSYIVDYCFRPFDIRKIIYHLDLLERGTNRYNIMQHFLKGDNLGICFIRNDYGAESFNYFGVTNKIVDIHFLGGQTYITPLYIFQKKSEEKVLFKNIPYLNKTPNFREDFQKSIKKYSFNLSPEQIIGYIYAIFHSPIYRDKYLELLKIDFPRVPFVENESIFKKLSNLGMELIEHHLMKQAYPKHYITFPVNGTDMVENLRFENGKAYINKIQYFDKIPSNIWDFHIGGYRVLDNWLKSRKERPLSYAEKETFIKIVNILGFTIKQMEKIAEIMG